LQKIRQTTKQKHKEKFYITLNEIPVSDKLSNIFCRNQEYFIDGNCQFEAIAHQLDKHHIYRSGKTFREVVRELKLNAHQYRDFLSFLPLT
jgi:hypothetical protein